MTAGAQAAFEDFLGSVSLALKSVPGFSVTPREDAHQAAWHGKPGGVGRAPGIPISDCFPATCPGGLLWVMLLVHRGSWAIPAQRG